MKTDSISSLELPVTTTPSFWVREVPVYGRAILAPMDGYSDWPFRSLCRMLGSAMSYTEFVQAEHIAKSERYRRKKLHFESSERPVVFQLYGDEPPALIDAALVVQELGPDIIDLNMGCPAKSVACRGAGVGLMRTPLKVARMLRGLVKSLHVPVTCKMRLGWNDARTYRLIAQIAEDSGVSLIAIHARTREQNYGGHAEWDAIAEIKASVGIPVIGNGDVKSPADVDRMRSHTACDAVMIGRAAIANPWIFQGLERDQVDPAQVRAFVAEHLERNIRFYGADDGPRLFRKHAVQYLLLRNLSREDRKDLLRQRPSEEFKALLNDLYTVV